MVAISANPDNDQVEILTDVPLLPKENKVESADYDQNPTQLFQLLESKDWKGVLKHIGESSNEVPIWVFRNSADGELRWCMLPIHASIIFGAPDEVILELRALYPNGSKCKDDRGMFPLHLAFKKGLSDAVLYEFVKCYPKAVEKKDNKGRTPLELYQNGSETCDFSIDPPAQRTYGCRFFPQFLDEGTRDEITPSVASSPLASMTKPTGICLYMQVFVESERRRIKRELKESIEYTMKCAEDDFKTKSKEINKRAADELHELKENHSNELDVLKESQAQEIKAIIDRMNSESAKETIALEVCHLKTLELKEQEMTSLQDRCEELLKTEHDELITLKGELQDELQNKVDEINAMREAHVEELKSKDEELNQTKKAHVNELMTHCDEMDLVTEAFDKDLMGKDNEIRRLNELHKKDAVTLQEDLKTAREKYETLRSSVHERFAELLVVDKGLDGEKN